MSVLQQQYRNMLNRYTHGKALVLLLALPALLIPTMVLCYIFWQAAPVLDWNFLFGTADGIGFGVTEGIFSQLVGSLLLATMACLIATPFALGTALYYRTFATPWQQQLLSALFNMLQGIPPIVFGLCGLVVLVNLFSWGVSLLSGAVVLAVVVLPLLALNTLATLERIPNEYSEAGSALGLTKGAIILRLWLPRSWRQLLTGLLLAMARALSETAPIMFTATVFSGVVWPDSIFSPVTTLQTHIFYLAQEGNDPLLISIAWGSAAVLVLLVAFFALLARLLPKSGGN